MERQHVRRRGQDQGSPPVRTDPYPNESFFTYSVEFPALAAAMTSPTPGIIALDTDSDFYWHKACYFVDLAQAAQTDSSRVVPLVTVLITPGGAAKPLMDRAVPVPSIFGTAQLPFVLPRPHRMAGGTSVNVAVLNYSAATTYANLKLALIGIKRFRG